MMYLGNFATGAIIDFKWSSNGADGASITRATNGTVSVYKGNSTTPSVVGVTDTEDFNALTGVHHCRITTASDAAFYAAGNDFIVVLSGAAIDTKGVNAVLAHFSIQNRYPAVADVQSGLATAAALTTVQGYVDELETRLTAARAGYLDTLNSGVGLSAAAVDAILDDVVEGTLTMRQMLRIMLAALAGKSAGGGTGTITFRDVADTKNRISTTVDANRNRTAVTRDGS
jgi:hypothetical protein